MTKVTILRKQDHIVGFVIEGHAGYGKLGNDIVCASVSILAYTTINSLIPVARVDKEDVKYSIDEKLGYLDVMVLNPNDKTQIVFDMFLVGIKMLAESYKDFVTIIE